MKSTNQGSSECLFNQGSSECLFTAYHQKVKEMQGLVADLQKQLQTYKSGRGCRTTNPLEVHQQLQRAIEYTDDPKLLTSLKKMKGAIKPKNGVSP